MKERDIYMKTWAFSKRVAVEIVRDPLTVGFGLGFPVALLFLLSAIQANIPVDLFAIETLAPGMTVFSFSFVTLFSATLLAKDRESAFLQRLYTTPLQAADFIIGYTLPVLPIALAQGLVCYLAAAPLGLPVTAAVFAAVLFLLPAALLFTAFGLLFGSILTVKQAGGVCGALFTNLTAWLSGIWFDLELVGGAFQKVANLLPFVHAVELERAVLKGNYAAVLPHFGWVAGYGAVIFLLAALLFLRQMKK